MAGRRFKVWATAAQPRRERVSTGMGDPGNVRATVATGPLP